MSAKLKKSPLLIIQRVKGANNVDPDEVAHHEPPHLDLNCLQIKLFFFCAFRVKRDKSITLTLTKLNFAQVSHCTLASSWPIPILLADMFSPDIAPINMSLEYCMQQSNYENRKHLENYKAITD